MRVTHRLFTKSSFPPPQESSRGIHTGVNEIVLSIHKAIPPFLWGRWVGPNRAILYLPRKDENFAYPTYKLRKNRTGSLTTCSAQFCVGSPATPAVPFWAPSCSKAAAICDVWFALPHPLPKGRTTRLFLRWMNAVLGKSHVCGCEQRLLTDQLLHNHTHSACLLTPHSPPHRDHVSQHMEGCGVSTEPSWHSRMEPRHMENRKTKTLLWTVTRCTAQ